MIYRRNSKLTATLAAAAGLLIAATAAGTSTAIASMTANAQPTQPSATTGNLVQDPNFSQVGSLGLYALCTHDAGCGPAAAADWLMYSNGATELSSDLLPSPNGSHPARIHLTTDGSISGLNEPGINVPANASKLIITATVFVVEGGVSINYHTTPNGQEDNTPALVFSTPGVWQTLTETVPSIPSAGSGGYNEMLIYSACTPNCPPFYDVYISNVSMRAIY